MTSLYATSPGVSFTLAAYAPLASGRESGMAYEALRHLCPPSRRNLRETCATGPSTNGRERHQKVTQDCVTVRAAAVATESWRRARSRRMRRTLFAASIALLAACNS